MTHLDDNPREDPPPVSQELADSVGTKYRLLAELGRGGMSDVYLALMTGAVGFSKLVVVKRLEPALARDAEFMHLFLDEARLAARLNHANVVQTHEVGYADGRYFIAMEYLEGQPLNRILRQALSAGGITLAAQLRILADALNGLHYAHELRDFDGSPLGVVHRDVSPQNVFVTYDGQVKLVDFGVAKAVTTRSPDTSGGGMIRGKIAYMAPEQARAEEVDRRADLFSMGVMLWEIAAGRRMWKGKNVPQILSELVAGRIPELHELLPGAPQELRAICARATSAAPELRYETAAQFKSELESLIEALAPKSAQDVGAQVSAAFGKQRAQVKALVELQLGHLRLGAGAPPPGFEADLPRLSDPEPPPSVPPSHAPPSYEPMAYGVHWSSIPPPQVGARSPLYSRAMAVLAVTAVLALIGIFSLILVAPGGAPPAAQPAPAVKPAAYAVAPSLPPIAAPAAAAVVTAPDDLGRDERGLTPRRAEPRRAYARELRDSKAGSEPLLPPIRRQKRALDKDDPWK